MKIIVTLGGPLNIEDCSPSSHLKSRLDETIKQYQQGDLVIVTGSRCQRLRISEAQVMADYLHQHNIPSVLEERALNTIQNAIFVKPILDQLVSDKSIPVIVITSDFHIARATLIFLNYFSDYNLFFHPSQTLIFDSLNTNEPAHLIKLINRMPLNDTVVLNIIEEAKRGYMKGVLERIEEIHMVESNTGNTALHYSASFGFTEITILLINRGINIDTQNFKGMTPLHYTIKNGKVADMWELLSHNANINLKVNNKDIYEFLLFNREQIPVEKYTVMLLMLLKFKRVTRCAVWIRHAETNQNFLRSQNRFEETFGIFDAEVTSNGYSMLEYINSWIVKCKLLEGFEVITSPLFRTLETTRVLTQGTEASFNVRVDHRIRERLNHTSCIGKPCSELKNMYSLDFSKIPELWWYNPEKNHNKTVNIEAESFDILLQRLNSFYTELKAKQKKTLIVTHGGVIYSLFNRKITARNCEAFNC